MQEETKKKFKQRRKRKRYKLVIRSKTRKKKRNEVGQRKNMKKSRYVKERWRETITRKLQKQEKRHGKEEKSNNVEHMN